MRGSPRARYKESAGGRAAALGGGSHHLRLFQQARENLAGYGGADVLSGAGGKDILIGGLGADSLSGGLAGDVFDFNAAAESTTATPERLSAPRPVFGLADSI